MDNSPRCAVNDFNRLTPPSRPIGRIVGFTAIIHSPKTKVMGLQGLFTATLSGIIIGILIAPAKGSDTREKLSGTAEQLRTKIRRIRGTTNDELAELHEVFEHEIAGLREDIREKVLRLIDVSKKGYYNVKSEALS